MTQDSNVSNLFENARDEGALSQEAYETLTGVIDIGEQIQAGLGTPADDVTASEVVLVTIMPDDSNSIAWAGNTGNVRAGHNVVLDALSESKQSDELLVHTRLLNGEVIYPFGPLDQAVRLDAGNYDPRYGTPLYDQSLVVLGGVLAKSQEFADNGVPVRTVTLIVTDGEDIHSRHTAADVAVVVRAMLAQENHIIAAMGIDDGHTSFRDVFAQMGILPQWILTPGNTDSEIRKAFQVFSQSAVRASQSAASFSQQQLGGGFGT